MKPKIYAFNNGGQPGWLDGVAVAEDGEFLTNHISSDEGWMQVDLGVTSVEHQKHDIYNAKYPEGWEIEFVSYDKVKDHKGLQKAFELNKLNFSVVKDEAAK
jgi:hypothetical protein